MPARNQLLLFTWFAVAVSAVAAAGQAKLATVLEKARRDAAKRLEQLAK